MIQSVKGTKDLLPENIDSWLYVENILRKVSESYGYRELRTPIFEKTEVFSRGVGEATDIVNKEMYTFIDKGGESITLRPEMTAALVRAVIQNNLLQQGSILRLWYFGPYFRYERPQKGRLRQFHQYGAECISSPHPESDSEIIHLACSLIKSLGINNFNMYINSLGNEASRKAYRDELIKYFTSLKNQLSEDSKTRIETNPLRILDSKDEADKEFIENAPKINEFLDTESQEHFNTVLELIKDIGANIILQPRLVRGLDYYSHTVFEFQSSELGAQDSFGGGGRYNTLFEQLGGKSAPAVGFAMGIERIILILEALNKLPKERNLADFYLIATEKEYFYLIQNFASELRNRGFSATIDLQRRSMKAQLREANKFGAKFVIILGNDEFENKYLTIKNMENSTQEQISFTDFNNFNFV